VPDISDYNQLATSFTITERTGDKRSVVLTGRALPYRPLTLSGSQRNTVEWYPGNPIGVAQIYGAKEEPTTINGMWKDIFLGEGNHNPYATVNGAPMLTVIDLAEEIDDIRRKGQEIVVTWLNHTRYGILSKFTQKWHNGHDMEYELEFTWIAQEDISLNTDVPFSPDTYVDLSTVPDQVQDLIDQFNAPSPRLIDLGITQGGAINGFATGFDEEDDGDVVDEINALVVSIQAQSDTLNDTVSSVANTVTAPADSLRLIAGTLDALKLNAQSTRDMLEEQADGARLNIGGTFGDVLSDRAASRGSADNMSQIQVLAASQEGQVLSQIQSQVLAVFQARQGDSLRKVSLIYYGTSDNWQSLMLYNQLRDEALVAGQVVIVPQRLPGAPQ
jgi:hypothetical protein